MDDNIDFEELKQRRAQADQLAKDILHAKIILAAAALLIVIVLIFALVKLLSPSSTEVSASTSLISEQSSSQTTDSEQALTELSSSQTDSSDTDSDFSQEALPDSYLIDGFDIIYQEPELPTGCEITALTMAINYYGFDVDKVTMAEDYLPCEEYNVYTGSDGLLYGNDLNEVFVGDPAGTGYICGTGAIITAANSYFADQGSELTAVDKTGITFDKLYGYVSEGAPVVVWVTIGMEDRREAEGWYTTDGEWVDWSTNNHGAVLIGYSEDTVTIADPISGIIEYDRAQFESVFESRGNQCVIIE
ncbi:MAG: C39 family peptidase [Ruminococcus sp.]|nr:C39 family peptidase [Ruminococcus sp.]